MESFDVAAGQSVYSLHSHCVRREDQQWEIRMSPSSPIPFRCLLAPLLAFIAAYFVQNSRFIFASSFLFAVGVAHLCHSLYRSFKITNINERAVLVTGCDTGFGHQVVIDLHAMGFTVFAGCLDDKSDGAQRLTLLGAESNRLHVIKMDITSQKQVDDAHRFVVSHLPPLGLWGIVNNAGLGNIGFIEWTSMEEYHKQIEVNLFGAIRVTKAFLPMLRKNQGRIVNVSSIMARIASPYSAAYCITKHGIGVYTDVLRMEMKRFNVTVCTIEPGNYLAATKLAGKDGPYVPVVKLWEEQSREIQEDYGKEQSLDRGMFYSIGVYMKLARTDVNPVVNAMTSALSRKFPKDRYFEATIPDLAVTYFYQFAPTFLSDRLILLLSQK